jgi:hypothetical protein
MADCSTAHEIISVPQNVNLRFHPRTTPRDGIRIEEVCIRCGHLPSLVGLILHEEDCLRITAPTKLSLPGSARELGFPALSALASLAPETVIQTSADRRIDAKLETLNNRYLNGLLRKTMSFSRGSWPKSIDCPIIGHPIILHPGLTEKFAAKHDVDHVRFAGYVSAVIRHPIEVWTNHDARGNYYHILGCLEAARKNYFMNVVVEADSHICDTAYVVDRNGRIENYRGNTPLLLAWGLKF